MLSICMTLKNRVGLVEGKLDELSGWMDYDPKQLEVCITDGGSIDGLFVLLDRRAREFGRVICAHSDRGKLPFRLPWHNPTCDVNAQIYNVARGDMIVRTDAEVRFTNRQTLRYIEATLQRPDVAIAFPSVEMDPLYKHPQGLPGVTATIRLCCAYKDSFFCAAFRRADYVANGGIHEALVMQPVGDDTYFWHWWGRNRIKVSAPPEHAVIHLHHPVDFPARWEEHRDTVTWPLLHRMMAGNVTPNGDNTRWQRPEMISDVRVWE